AMKEAERELVDLRLGLELESGDPPPPPGRLGQIEEVAEALDHRQRVAEARVVEGGRRPPRLEAIQRRPVERQRHLEVARLVLADHQELAPLPLPRLEEVDVVRGVDAGVGGVERLEAAVERAQGLHWRTSERLA